jgi:hypothetical protein
MLWSPAIDRRGIFVVSGSWLLVTTYPDRCSYIKLKKPEGSVMIVQSLRDYFLEKEKPGGLKSLIPNWRFSNQQPVTEN